MSHAKIPSLRSDPALPAVVTPKTRDTDDEPFNRFH